MGLTKDQVWQAGSVLGTVGAAKINKFQKVYMEHHLITFRFCLWQM